jgi:hypothetical protein
MSMNVVGSRFTPPTTQVKASNSQRTGAWLPSEKNLETLCLEFEKNHDLIRTGAKHFSEFPQQTKLREEIIQELNHLAKTGVKLSDEGFHAWNFIHFRGDSILQKKDLELKSLKSSSTFNA